MPMSILIVDDERVNRHALRSLLRRADYGGVEEVPDAAAAFEALGLSSDGAEALLEDPPEMDLVLMGLSMPGVDGLEACRRIKRHDWWTDLPIIVVTASIELESLKKSFAAGAIDYIQKPVRQVELLARVRSALRLKRETDARKRREAELEAIRRELEDANQELKRLAVEDPVTGISNRRVFDERLRVEWARAIRHSTPVGLVMIDVDHFKAFNDTYGHQDGDRALREVARALRSSGRRAADLVARYGGEEFAAILPGVDEAGAAHVATLMCEAVRALGIPHADSEVGQVTVSSGCASAVPRRGSEAEQLIESADQALYGAKDGGRNRACAHGSLCTPASG